MGNRRGGTCWVGNTYLVETHARALCVFLALDPGLSSDHPIHGLFTPPEFLAVLRRVRGRGLTRNAVPEIHEPAVFDTERFEFLPIVFTSRVQINKLGDVIAFGQQQLLLQTQGLVLCWDPEGLLNHKPQVF
jgi:hypothetical protein